MAGIPIMPNRKARERRFGGGSPPPDPMPAELRNVTVQPIVVPIRTVLGQV